MNSNLTQRWLMPALASALLMLTAARSSAQCTLDALPLYAPVPTFNLAVDATYPGEADLNGFVVSSFFYSDCPFTWVRFYDAPTGGNYLGNSLTFSCSEVGSSFTYWISVRDAGNTPASESPRRQLVVNIVDATLPIAGPAPADVTVNSSDDGTGDCTLTDVFGSTLQDIGIFAVPAAPGQNEYTDNCLDNLTVTYQLSGATTQAEGPAPLIFPGAYDAGLATFNAGVTTVTYRIYDNLADPLHLTPLVIQTTVTVLDDENPVITCPVNQNLSTDAGVCTRAVSNLAAASYADNCSVSAVTWTAPGATPAASAATGLNKVNATFPIGITTVTFKVKDSGGLTATCSFDVKVTDGENPEIECPASLTVDASNPLACNYVAGLELDYLSATDNCTVSSVTNNINGTASLNAETFLLGVTNVVWTASDAQGNTKTCALDITVEDNTPPVGPGVSQVINVNVTPGDCSATVSYEYPGLFFYNPSECTPPVDLTEGPAVVNGVSDPNFLLQLLPFSSFSGRMNFIFGAGATLTFPVGQTVIPYTWSDQAGNKTVETVTVNVFETIKPTAACKPGIITLPLDAAGNATLTTAMVDNGSSDNCSTFTLGLSKTAFSCADVPGTQTVTLTVTDASSNSSTCTATIDVVDNIAPQLLCPGGKTVTSNMGCQAFNLAGIGMSAVAPGTPLAPGQYSDNCNNATVSWALSGATTGSGSGSVPAGQGFNKGVTTVTYTVSDGSNSAVCNFTVNITDNTPPTWTGTGQAAGSTITVNANMGGCVAQVSWPEPTFTDACTPPVTVTKTHNPGGFFVFGPTTVTYTAIDGAGNVATHAFTVNVVDTQAPVAKCKDLTVSLDGAGAAGVTAPQVDNLSTDNCFFTFTSPSASYDCTKLGNNNYTLQITDGSGNTATCVATIKVVDNIAPTALCKSVSPIVLNTTSFALDATTVNNNSTDNTYPLCGLTFAVSVDGSAYAPSFTFTCAHVGNRVLTLRVTDAAGNTATCSQSVAVQDKTAPALTPPANTTVNCDASTNPTNTGTYSGLSDNCDANPAVVQLADLIQPGSCANKYSIIRSWRATDASGNSTTVSQTITVQDVTKPVFHISSVINLNTDNPLFCDAPLTLQLTKDSVSDNCTSNFASFGISYTIDYPTPAFGYVDVPTPTAGNVIPGNHFPIGKTVVVWTVVDACGNSATQSVSVIVKDTKAPVFFNGYESNCGKAYVLPNTTGACSNLFTWARPNAAFPHVKDCLDFTVTENIDNTTVQSALNLTNPFNYTATLSFQVFPTAQFPVGKTTVSYTATDAKGNSAVCSFTVEVEDTQAPVLTCPPNQILAATCPTAQIPDYTNLVSVSDNCPANVNLTQSIPGGTTLSAIFAPNPPLAGNQFTITMTGDEGYNTAICSFTVTLKDGDAPIPTVATLPALIDSCGTLIVKAPSATDPCNPGAPIIYGTPSTPVGTFINTIPPSYQLNPGSYVITWVYNDGNGNISTQPQNITVLNDIFPPVAICVPNLTVNLDGVTGQVAILANQLNNGSYDPNKCGPLTFSVSPSPLTCANAGPSPTTVTLTVRDAKNNPATCTTSVTVKDVTAPAFSTPPADLTVEACNPIASAVKLTATDACGGTSTITATTVSTQDTTGGPLKYNYTITNTWKASDPSGNTTIATQVITVKDTKKPVFTGAPTATTVVTDPTRLSCDDTVNINILPFISDCATGADLSVTNNKEPGDGGNLSAIYGVGTHTVVFTATDISGNSATHSVSITVKDGTPPTAVCINGVSAALQPSGSVVVNFAQFNNNSYDNCTPSGQLDLKIQRQDKSPLQAPSTSITYDCSDADGVTKHPLKLFVADANGNMSMCETYIVIQDNVKPTVTLCPTDKTVLCTDTLSTKTYGTALVTDNCPNNVSVSYSDSLAAGSGQFCYAVKRYWKATDLAGNTAICVQLFSVLDTIKPVLSQYPKDITISCSENLAPPSNITASDNCTPNLSVTFVQDTVNIAPGLCGKYNYTVTRTRTAQDNCGNKVVYTNKITVVDNEAPKFLGMPDTLVIQSANFQAATNCMVPVTFDVSQYLVDCAPLDELLVLNDAPQGNDSLNINGDYAIGTYKVHFSALDPCGNLGKDSIILRVIDNSKPTAICNNNVVVSLGTDGTATIQADDIDLGSSDNCGIDTMFLNVSKFDCGDLGQQAVTLTVIDPNGNSNTCTVNVNVTLGNSSGFILTATGFPESYFGADNGKATALATGGSGNFTYVWSNAANTATVSNLSAGTYTVTATDTNTGCFKTDTAVVQAGAKLAVKVGTVSGAQGVTVKVPVTVDNFNAMVGLSFSMHVTDLTVGKIIGSSNPNPMLGSIGLNLVGNDLTVFWAHATPVNLPNGAVLFNLDVQLGNAPVGSTSPVTIDGTPTAISFQQDSSGIPVATMAALTNGSVTISQVAVPELEISGDIKTWAGIGTPVPGVVVALGGGVTSSQTTTATGAYQFMVPVNTNTTVNCSKTVTSEFSKGINVGDLLAIQNHAAQVTPLTNPYQFVAGDVNNNNKVDLPDYLLVQQLILGTVQHYSNGAPDWKFIPTAYAFPTPNPLSAPYPQSISHTPAASNFVNDDFTAVRIGDVTGNAPVTNVAGNVDDRSGDVFKFHLEQQSIHAGEWITVPFKASDFTGRQAYQMTIVFDPNVLELADIQPGVLPNMNTANFGTAHLADGYLTTLWVSTQAQTFADGEVLFTLTFRALESGPTLSDVLRPGSAVTAAEALDADGNSMDIEFDWAQALSGNEADRTSFALYQNQPNPFREQTTIGFRLPQAGRAIVRVYSTDGRLVKMVVGNFAQGYNTVVFEKGELGAPGVYWYELESATNSDRKKMILMD